MRKALRAQTCRAHEVSDHEVHLGAVESKGLVAGHRTHFVSPGSEVGQFQAEYVPMAGSDVEGGPERQLPLCSIH